MNMIDMGWFLLFLLFQAKCYVDRVSTHYTLKKMIFFLKIKWNCWTSSFHRCIWLVCVMHIKKVIEVVLSPFLSWLVVWYIVPGCMRNWDLIALCTQAETACFLSKGACKTICLSVWTESFHLASRLTWAVTAHCQAAYRHGKMLCI